MTVRKLKRRHHAGSTRPRHDGGAGHRCHAAVQTSVSERAWEEDILSAVSAAVHADRTLDAVAVKPLEYEDCQWVFEGGMPMPDYDVTVDQRLVAFRRDVVSREPGSQGRRFAVLVPLPGEEGADQEVGWVVGEARGRCRPAWDCPTDRPAAADL